MRVGVVAEGWADYHVIRAILRATVGVDGEDVRCLRPEDVADETDRHSPGAATFSNWEIVLQECQSGARIRAHLDSPIVFDGDDGKRLAVVHIDTAEAHHPAYGVRRPDRKAPDAPARLRDAVAVRLRSLLTEGGCGDAPVALAVAVEETEAWLLAGLREAGDTGLHLDPKARLARWVEKRALKLPVGDVARARELAKTLRRRKDLDEACARNGSLAAFVGELDSAAPPAP